MQLITVLSFPHHSNDHSINRSQSQHSSDYIPLYSFSRLQLITSRDQSRPIMTLGWSQLITSLTRSRHVTHPITSCHSPESNWSHNLSNDITQPITTRQVPQQIPSLSRSSYSTNHMYVTSITSDPIIPPITWHQLKLKSGYIHSQKYVHYIRGHRYYLLDYDRRYKNERDPNKSCTPQRTACCET